MAKYTKKPKEKVDMKETHTRKKMMIIIGKSIGFNYEGRMNQ